MTVAAAVAAPWHRAHVYKALAGIVFVLIALQYLLSGAIDRRSIETIFTINTSRLHVHHARRPAHQRAALVIYGAATSSSSSTNAAAAEGAVDDDAEPPPPPPPPPGGNSSTGNNNNSGNLTTVQVNSSSSSSSSTVTSNNSSALLKMTNSSSAPVIIVEDAAVAAKLKNTSGSASVAVVVTMQPGGGGSSSTTTLHGELARCPLVPPNLVGPIAVSKSPPDLAGMEKAFAKVKPGGRGLPEDCAPRYRVAIVVPFRDRFPHLMTLLYNLHPLLLRQQLDYQIFVIEQEGNMQFNRAMLMNVGYVEALKERQFDCFVFHDVDLLPEDDRNLYTCPEQPRHMSVAVDKFLYKLPYSDLFGGVSAMTTDHFRLVNGFSNVFWGWGGEDDDMANRIKARGLHISRYPANIARYKMLTHKKEKANPKRYEFLKTGKKRFLTDGLSNLQYEIVSKKKPKLYTWFLVRLTPPTQPS